MKKLKIISISLILVGIIIISYALFAKYWTMHVQNNMISKYEQQIKKAKHKKNNSVVNAQPISKEEYGTIGILSIPKINLKVAINDGVDLHTLKYAVGHFKNTAMPGKVGNFCVAGHRSYTYGEYFNRLNEIKTGDEMTVKTVNGDFKYKVYDIKVVLPGNTEVLNPTSFSSMTLVTCTPLRVGTHRLIVKCKLEN